MSLKDYILKKPSLETERLILRPLVLSDAADLKQWLPDPELYTYWGRPALKAELDPKLLFIEPNPRIKRSPDTNFRWGIVLKSAGRVIGEIFLTQIEDKRMAKVAYRIARDYRGLGITTEALGRVIGFAFRETELLRLWTDVDDRNIASRRVLEKCGFTCEGLIRQGKLVLTYCNYRIYGILKEDYIT